jgi:probable rRNA maturation factor
MAYKLSISTLVLEGAFNAPSFKKANSLQKTGRFNLRGFESKLKFFYQQLKKESWVLAKQSPILRKRMRRGPQSVTVVLMPAREIKKVNRVFRGKNYPPDVLSFLNPEHREGEILLCPQVIWAQAQQAKTKFEDEVKLLLIHGWLHLLGYDHEGSKAQARRMYSIQNKLVLRLANTAPLF